MTAERHLPAPRVVGVIEVVISVWVGADHGVVDFRRERQRRATAPTADQLCGEQFSLCLGGAIRLEESIEGTHAGLIFAKAHISAVATEDVGPWHRQRHSSFTGISKDELASLNWFSLPRQRIDTA